MSAVCVCVCEQKWFPLIIFFHPTQNGGKSSLSPGSSKYWGSSMRDTAAEKRGRQRRSLDFPGEYSVESYLKKPTESTGIDSKAQHRSLPWLQGCKEGTSFPQMDPVSSEVSQEIWQKSTAKVTYVRRPEQPR